MVEGVFEVHSWTQALPEEGIAEIVLAALRQQLPPTTLWRRQMVLGPGTEFAIIVPPAVNIAAPSGWSALAIERVRVDAPP
jgi:hypothetical protein